MSRILLAPMEGLADPLMRDVLTAIGGYDWGICEFIRVSESVLPNRTYQRICPELLNDSRTAAGTPMRVQLLGSDPYFMAENARRALKTGPASTSTSAVRRRPSIAIAAAPRCSASRSCCTTSSAPCARLFRSNIPFTAKMRLGIDDDSPGCRLRAGARRRRASTN